MGCRVQSEAGPPQYCDTPDSYCKGIWAGERGFSSVFRVRSDFTVVFVFADYSSKGWPLGRRDPQCRQVAATFDVCELSG